MIKICKNCGSSVEGFKCPKCSRFCADEIPEVVEEEFNDEVCGTDILNDEDDEIAIDAIIEDEVYEDEIGIVETIYDDEIENE